MLEGETAGPSTPLRSVGITILFGNGWYRFQVSWILGERKLQIPPLRFAPVGMTKGGLGHHLMLGNREG